MKKTTTPTEPANHIAAFQESSIRRVWHNEEWCFSVVNICAILTSSPDAGAYDNKKSEFLELHPDEGRQEWGGIISR